ncbi:holin [Streptomyces mutabilis]|uniref:holin n=1 Tax=Streptomyces mutabilis TaxID=67332 RepID=UPI0036653DAB
MAAPVEKKVTAATAGTYVASTGVLAGLEAIEDHAQLVSFLPPALAPFVLALVPAAIAFVSGYRARHTPRGVVE